MFGHPPAAARRPRRRRRLQTAIRQGAMERAVRWRLFFLHTPQKPHRIERLNPFPRSPHPCVVQPSPGGANWGRARWLPVLNRRPRRHRRSDGRPSHPAPWHAPRCRAPGCCFCGGTRALGAGWCQRAAGGGRKGRICRPAAHQAPVDSQVCWVWRRFYFCHSCSPHRHTFACAMYGCLHLYHAVTPQPSCCCLCACRYMKLLLVGESGLGKTTFVRNLFAAYARDASFPVNDASTPNAPQVNLLGAAACGGRGLANVRACPGMQGCLL